MKRTAWLLLLLLLLGCLVACDATTEEPPEEPAPTPLTCTHTFSEWHASEEPSCLQRGRKWRICVDCGEMETKSHTALGHTEVVDAAVPAGCLTTGLTEGAHCEVCLAITKAQTVTPATGHSYEESVLLAATCQTEGRKKYTCSGCGDSYEEGYALEKYTPGEIYELALRCVGELQTFDAAGNSFLFGTGVSLGTGRILTNYHVIEGAHSAEITIAGQKHPILSVLAYHKATDLAVLQIGVTNLPFLPICRQAPDVGETVYAFGSSKGMTSTLSHGMVTRERQMANGALCVQHNAAVSGGNSGGPLINAYGEMIGVNTWTLLNAQNLNFSVSVTEMDKLTYGTPLTLAEVTAKENRSLEKLIAYISTGGTVSGGVYKMTIGASLASDLQTLYERTAVYDPAAGTVTLQFAMGSDCSLSLVIGDLSGRYTWRYTDKYGRTMSGTLRAATYTASTMLAYSANNITSAATRIAVQELASSMMSALCACIDVDLAAAGVTRKGLGFLNYS